MRKFVTDLQIKALDEDERVIEGIASTGSPDRMQDVVEPLGAKFKLPIPLLLDHRHDLAVGVVESARATKAGVTFRARIPKIDEPGEAKNLVDRAWHFAKHGLRRSVSIGFRPLETARLDSGGYRFAAWEWLELSLVAIPAQPEAEILATRTAGQGPMTIAEARAIYARLVAKAPERTVSLSAADLARGRNLLDAADRAETRKALGQDRGHVVAVTPEAAARRAHIERLREENYSRQWRAAR